MSMTVIRPTEITDAMLVETSLSEDTTSAWSSGTTYALADEVHLAATHRRYRSLQGSNTNHDPTSATPGVPTEWWADVGPTNAWAMFDTAVQSVSSTADPTITVQLAPGSIGGIVLTRLQASRVSVEAVVDAEIVYSSTVDLSTVAIVDWYTWTTAPFRYRKKAAFLDLPVYASATWTLTISGDGVNKTEVGVLAVGSATAIGNPRMGLQFGGIDYSRVETDEYGVDRIVKRANADELDFELFAADADIDVIANTLNDIFAIPCAFVPSTADKFAHFITFGLCETWKARREGDNFIVLNGHIRGLV